MRAHAVLLVALLGLACVAVADDQVDWQDVVGMFQERDRGRIGRLSVHSVEGLSLDHRNAVSLAAARSLAIDKYIGAIGEDTIHEHFTKSPANDSPAEAECRRQWGINKSAASLLQYLAENRLINDPRVLPYLIEGLDHPDRHGVGQPCFSALQSLTRHRSGHIHWSRLVEDEKTHRAVSQWWRAWWRRNSDKHPVFDAQMEQRARAEIRRLVRRIEIKVKPYHRELALFSMPEMLRLRQSPLFQVEYNPRLFDNFPVIVDWRTLPWLYMRCRFLSEDLPAATEDPRRGAPAPPRELTGAKRTVYAAVLRGTDVVVEVIAASKDEKLLTDLQQALNGSN